MRRTWTSSSWCTTLLLVLRKWWRKTTWSLTRNIRDPSKRSRATTMSWNKQDNKYRLSNSSSSHSQNSSRRRVASRCLTRCLTLQGTLTLIILLHNRRIWIHSSRATLSLSSQPKLRSGARLLRPLQERQHHQLYVAEEELLVWNQLHHLPTDYNIAKLLL